MPRLILISGEHEHFVSGAREARQAVGNFFRLVAAGPFFFVSAWLLMIFAGIVATDVGIRPFGYLTSMVATIGLWLVLAPAVGAVARMGNEKMMMGEGKMMMGKKMMMMGKGK